MSHQPVLEEQEGLNYSEQDKSLNATVESPGESDQLKDHHTDYSDTRLIVLEKAEIQAAQYRGSLLRTAILLFSAFILGYGYGLDANVRYVYTAFASASYGHHSLISTIGVVNGVIGAGSQIVYARLSDVFGRLYILIVAIVFYVVGTIIQSQAYDIQRYCAGAVFYNLGYVGVILVVLLILSDMSTLKWRLFYQFVPSLPFIINTWISGNITSAVGESHWSWGIGMWAFIFPLSCIPFVCCLLHMRYMATKTPEWQELKTNKQTYYQKHGLGKTLMQLFWRLDVIGVLILIICLGCILVPLTLAAGVSHTWKSGKIIGPLVLGFVLLPVWIIYEKYAPHPMAPFPLLKDRGVWAALGLSFLLDFIFYMASDYLYTILIVAVNQSVASATRITSISSFVGVVWSPLFAVIVAYVKRLKPFIVMGCSIWFLACGLLYHFRGGAESKSGIIGALVVWGIGTTMFSYPITVSLQSATTHEHMATVTALSYAVYRIGNAVGNAVSGAVWTQLLPARLTRNLNNATMASEVFADPYTFCASHPWGTPDREGVVEAYKYIQRLETIIALCFCTLLVAFSLFLRDPALVDKTALDDEIKSDVVIKEDDSLYTKTFGKIFGRTDKSSASSTVSGESKADSL